MPRKMERLTFRISPELVKATKARAKALRLGHHEYLRKVLADDAAPTGGTKVVIPGVTD